jgi:hypothetical protein
VPLDSPFAGEPPQLVALATDGSVGWRWRGRPECHFAVVAQRGGRLALVESHRDGDGRFLLLAAADGSELRATPLGLDIEPLNWRRGHELCPAPAALLLTDLASPAQRERRLYCLGIDDGLPSFVEPVNRALGDFARDPQFGPDLLLFGLSPPGPEPFRLYALQLADRAGAFAGGRRYRSLPLADAYAQTAVGPYTVLCCTGYLVVLGPEERK